MSKGNSGLFHGTLGTTRINSSQENTSYSDRGLDIPEHIKNMLSKLKKQGDRIIGTQNDFSMKDVSIMSKETGVEFARITIGEKVYLYRGDDKGVPLSDYFKHKIAVNGGTLDFHTHPYDNDCVPSVGDCRMVKYLREHTGKDTSKIVTPNGRLITFSEHGVVSVGTIPNIIDDDARQIYLKLFGGE